MEPNPFQPAPGATPPALVGREAEAASIDDALERAETGGIPLPLAFVGLRGLGKTVLLNLVHERVARGIVLSLEVERGVPLATSLRNGIAAIDAARKPLPARVGSAIRTALRDIPLPAYEPPGNVGEFKLVAPAADEPEPADLPLGRAIEALNDAIRRTKHYLAITIDEVHAADVAGLRSVVAAVHRSAQTGTPILFACAGLPESFALFAKLPTYVRRWDTFELGFLTRAESALGIRLPLERAGVTIDDDALDLLVENAAGYPFFLQRYASEAWKRRKRNRITRAAVSETLEPVRALVEKTYYADDFKTLSPRERLFCRELAALGPGPHELGRIAAALGVKSLAISSIRGNLIKKGIVFVPASGDIQFRMPLAERYVLQHPEYFDDERVRAYREKLSPS